jgi:D-glycero-D-manno-heptose 1,7-bisphosphate phosphatase
MRLCLLDRDGVVVVNRRENIKRPDQLTLIDGAAEAIAQLNQAGVTVAICTNQPEVGRGAMTRRELDVVHAGLEAMLRERGAAVDRIFAWQPTAQGRPRRRSSATRSTTCRRLSMRVASVCSSGRDWATRR